jgi:hypothetical protein
MNLEGKVALVLGAIKGIGKRGISEGRLTDHLNLIILLLIPKR